MKHEHDRARRLSGMPALYALLAVGVATPAFALSEIKREELPPPPASSPTAENDPFPGNAVPMPEPIQNPPSLDDSQEIDPAPTGPSSEDEPDPDPDAPLPEILRDLSLLPEPARRMHRLIVEACRSGNIEALRPLVGTGEDGTQLSFGGAVSDPIAFLKELSGDQEGQEILAILLEVLGAGYVHLDADTESELFVWPYFFAVPLAKLTAPQRVELFTIVTAGDYEEMKAYGAYIFYRVGITPDGRWAFFVAGD